MTSNAKHSTLDALTGGNRRSQATAFGDENIPMKDASSVEMSVTEDLNQRALSSPFKALLGLHIVEWDEHRCVVEIPVTTALTNFSGGVAGPVVAAAIDMAATLAGCFTPAPASPLRAVTLSLTVAFIGSTTEGVIRATAIKQGGGKRIFTSTVCVTSADGAVLATGQGTCRYIQ